MQDRGGHTYLRGTFASFAPLRDVIWFHAKPQSSQSAAKAKHIGRDRMKVKRKKAAHSDDLCCFHLRDLPIHPCGLSNKNTLPTGRVSACGLEFDEDDQQSEEHE